MTLAMAGKIGSFVTWARARRQAAVMCVVVGLMAAAVVVSGGALTGGQRLGGGGHPNPQPNPVIDPPELD